MNGGRLHFYLRRPGHKPIPLPHETDPGFLAAYQAAIASTEAETPKHKVGGDSFAALVDAWQASAHFRQLSAATQNNYRRILSRMSNEDYADHKVRDFEAKHIRRFVARRSDTPAAANHWLRLFRMLFQFAVEDGWREADPTLGVKRLKEAGEGAKSWSESEIEQFERRWPSGSPPRLALALLLYTGQRRSNVVRMGWDDVQDGMLLVRQVKTGSRLLIPIHEMLLREIEQQPATAALFLLTREGLPKGFTPNGFYMRFVAWFSDAGLGAGLSPHGLRKAAARRSPLGGIGLHAASDSVDHRS